MSNNEKMVWAAAFAIAAADKDLVAVHGLSSKKRLVACARSASMAVAELKDAYEHARSSDEVSRGNLSDEAYFQLLEMARG
jgi:hypothetical protein